MRQETGSHREHHSRGQLDCDLWRVQSHQALEPQETYWLHNVGLGRESPSEIQATGILRAETDLLTLDSHEGSLKHLGRQDGLGMETEKSYYMELSSCSSQRP